jgi:hypothetical protein
MRNDECVMINFGCLLINALKDLINGFLYNFTTS